jgi:hypothetical protein
LIDFLDKKEEDKLYPSPLIQGKRIDYPAGTHRLLRISNPGDPKIFIYDLLVIEEEYKRGRIIGLSVPSWEWKAKNGMVSIVPFVVLESSQSTTKDDEAEEDASEAASAS